MYRLSEASFIVKYVDDEGDQISVTTTEELAEAFRLAKDLVPPILRINVYRTKNVVVPKNDTEVLEKEVEKEESHEYPPLPVSEWDAPQKKYPVIEEQPVVVSLVVQHQEEEVSEPTSATSSNEYPPLPVSEWDAPKKKPVLLVNVKIPEGSTSCAGSEVTIPISISAQIQRTATDTTKDVCKYAQATMDGSLHFSKSNIYAELSSSIAAQCKELSHTTAEMSKKLATIQAEESIRTDIAKEVSELSLATMRECQKLSEATALICNNLSAATIEGCKSYAASANALLVDGRTQHLDDLSDDIKGKCNQLAAETSASSSRRSAEIRKMIMDL